MLRGWMEKLLEWVDSFGTLEEFFCQQYTLCPSDAWSSAGVLWLDGPATKAELEAHISVALTIPSFRTEIKATKTFGGFRHHHVDLGDVDVQSFVQHVVLPLDSDDDSNTLRGVALENWLSDEVLAKPYKPCAPSWECYLVDFGQGETVRQSAQSGGADGESTGSVVVLRFHHALGDAYAMGQLCLRIFHPPPLVKTFAENNIETETHSSRHRMPRRRVNSTRMILLFKSLRSWAWSVLQALSVDAFVLCVKPYLFTNSKSVLTPYGQNTGRRSVRFLSSVPLDKLKCVSRRLNVTITEILLVVAAGALRRYCLEVDPHFVSKAAPTLRAAVAKNLRLSPHSRLFRSHVNVVHVKLPITLPDVASRIKAVRPWGKFARCRRVQLLLKALNTASNFVGWCSPLWWKVVAWGYFRGGNRYGRLRDCIALSSVRQPPNTRPLYVGTSKVTHLHGMANYGQNIVSVGYENWLDWSIVVEEGVAVAGLLAECFNTEMEHVINVMNVLIDC